MENAADALKIAFAIFAFVFAITITFSVISQAKSTSDYVLQYSDKTNYYEHLYSGEKNRVVSTAEVISTLHRYYNDSISVTINLNDKEYIFDTGRETVIKENGDIDKDASNKINTNEQKEKNLDNFIKNKLSENRKFAEEFVEVPISGIYQTGEDDTEIILSSGGKKVYITYTLQ